MMQDHTFDNIIDEIHKEFPIPLPRMVIRVIIKTTLYKMFKVLSQKDTVVKIPDSNITKFYNRIDFKNLQLEFMDLNESTEFENKLIDPKLLRKFHAKRSPRFKVRGKYNPTYVYHRRVG